jgi:hypothetical protein
MEDRRMAETGTMRLLKSLGLDTEGMQRDAQQFMQTIQLGVEKINANQERIESKLDRIEKILNQPGHTSEIRTASGEPTGVLVTTERFPQEMIDDAQVVGSGV